MKKGTKKFIKNLTLQTPLTEIKEHCKTDKDTLLIMNHIYKLMANKPSAELSDDLKFTFAGEKERTEKTKINEQQWKEILDSYHNYESEEEKLKAFQKIVQVFEGYVEIEREKVKEDAEGQAKLFLKAKELFKDVPKEQLKTSLIQRKMQIGYGKASRIKDYLLGEN
jgi:DNA segregation ATPase FtsK/SpoIIIE-like protein